MTNSNGVSLSSHVRRANDSISIELFSFQFSVNFDRCVVWGTWWRKGLWDWLCWYVSYVQQSYCCSSKNVIGMSFTLGGFRETSPESIKIVYGSQPTVIFLIVYSTLLLLSDFQCFMFWFTSSCWYIMYFFKCIEFTEIICDMRPWLQTLLMKCCEDFMITFLYIGLSMIMLIFYATVRYHIIYKLWETKNDSLVFVSTWLVIMMTK